MMKETTNMNSKSATNFENNFINLLASWIETFIMQSDHLVSI